MRTNKFLIAGVAGGVAAFLAGWVIWGLALYNFMEAHSLAPEGTVKDPMNMVALFIANLAAAFLLAYIFERWAHIHTLSAGAVAGAIITFFIAVFYDTINYATLNLLDMTGMIVDIIASVVHGAVVGAVVGWVLGMGKKTATA